MIVKLLTEHHLEFLSIKRGCSGSSESTHVKMPHCWKSHALAILMIFDQQPQCTSMEQLVAIWLDGFICSFRET